MFRFAGLSCKSKVPLTQFFFLHPCLFYSSFLSKCQCTNSHETDKNKKQKIFNIIFPIFSSCLILFILDNTRLPTSHRHKILPNGTLVITDSHKSDTGSYSCSMRDAKVSSEKKITRLRVIGKLQLKDKRIFFSFSFFSFVETSLCH